MKRILSATLILFLLSGLCACNSKPSAEQTQPPEQNSQQATTGQDPEQAESSKGPDYALMLQVTINPEFTLYLDKEMNILSAEAGNADAEKLFAQADVSGKSYSEGMAALLDEAFTQGYLKDNTTISVTIAAAWGATVDYPALCAPVSQFDQEQEITTELSVNLLPEDVPEEDKIEINGQTLYIQQIPVMDENEEIGILTVYSYKKSLFSRDPLKYAVKSVYQGHNGDYGVTYYADGIIFKELYTNADGTYRFSEYENGIPVTLNYKDENGIDIAMTYYSDGTKRTVSTRHADGDYQNEFYYENGNPEQIEMQMDGAYANTTYYEDGSPHTSDYSNADGTSGKATYDQSGNYLHYERYEANGEYVISTYYENGKEKATTQLVDGAYLEATYNEDGSPSYMFSKNSDGSQVEQTYYSNGQMASYKEYKTNGDYYITTFYENGQPASQEGLSDGFYSKWLYDADGTVQYYQDNTEGGQEFFYSGGELIKYIIGGITYTVSPSDSATG